MVCCRTLLESDGTGLQEQTAEVLRMLLDTETLDSAPEKDDFLELFYTRYMSHLVQVRALGDFVVL